MPAILSTPTETTSPDNKLCGNCFYWDRNGRCHFNAPIPAGFHFLADWPRVDQEDWCGSWSSAAANGGGGGTVGPPGPPGPTAVSTDPNNLATLGSDSLLFVPDTYAFKGVTDGTDADPENVGAYFTVDNISGVALATNVPLAICTMSLPPGCFEVWGAVDFTVAGVEALAGQPIQPNQLGAAISTTPDSLPTDEELILGTGVMQLIYSPLASGQRQVLITGQCRSNSPGPVDLYLVAQIGLGNCTARGYVSARRVR